METSAAAAQQRSGAWAKNNGVYWAIFTRIPSHPIVSASHYGARVDCATECDGLHAHLFTTEAAALARLAILPTHYSRDGVAGAGAPIDRECGRVMFHSGGYFYDVVSYDLSDLRPGMRVNVGTIGGGDYWQTIASIESRGRVGGQWRGADVYAIHWQDVEPLAAPSLFSSRRTYDVLRTEY